MTTRATTSAAMILMMLAGCSGDYERSDLGDDSPRMRQVRRMVHSLQVAGGDASDEELAGDAAPGLDQPRREALVHTLRQIASALSAEVTSLDRFGKNIYRAAVELRSDDGNKAVTLLLVEREGELRWAGRN